MGKIRWGILGYARIARESVIPAIVRSDNAEIRAIASRDGTKLAECLARYPFPASYASYEDLLADPDVDAVYIPLPNALHCDWAIRAMKMGKHVLCEKPLALTEKDAREMASVAEEHKVNLMEAFMYRFTPRILAVQNIISSGEIGEIRHIASTFRFLLANPASIKLKPELGGGSLLDVGCYPVNFIGMLTGEAPIAVASRCILEGGIDVNFSAVLTYPRGITATVNSGFNAFRQVESTIVGTKGILYVPDTFLDNPGELTIRGDAGERTVSVEGADRYRLEIEEFSGAILEGRKPALDIAEAVRNCGILEQLQKP